MRGDDDVLDSSPSKEARSCLMLISGHLLCLLREQEQSADSLGRSNSPGREQAEPPHERDVEPIKLYIMADKLNMEQCVNDTLDQYQSYLRFQDIDCDSFEHLVEFGPPRSKPRDLLVAEMAYEARLDGFETYKSRKPVVFSAFVELDLDNALHFAQCISDVRKSPAQQTKGCK